MSETKTPKSGGFYKNLTPGQKKLSVYAGMLLSAAAIVFVMTRTTEPAVADAAVSARSLTGGADVRAVTIDGMGERLKDLEKSTAQRATDLDRTLSAIQSQLGELRDEMAKTRSQSEEAARGVRTLSNQPAPAPSPSPVEEDVSGSTDDGATTQSRTATQVAAPAPQKSQADLAAERAAQDREARRLAMLRREQEDREALYSPGDPMPNLAAPSSAASSAPRISVFQSDAPAEEIIDAPEVKIQIPAGSIIPSVMITGVDAPTGARASGQPVPVLFKIEREAIMPNDAYGDVVECHLLGAAYGELASERVYVRGETISCVLTDNTTVESPIKFYVAGTDGKNGLRGQLITRSGRLIAGAAGAAVAQGIVGAFGDSGDTVGLEALVGTKGGVIDGASEGFDKIADYYIEMAEETFPVIEVTNGQWADVILTQGVELAWKGAYR